MRRIQVTIDALVLKGFRHSDREAVAAGLKREINRQLSHAGMAGKLSGLGSIPLLRAGNIPMKPGLGPGPTGAAVGRAIGRSLGK